MSESVSFVVPRVRSRALPVILIFAGVLFGVGVGWGLPNNETWESDSLAPYHPLVGLSQLFSFGYFNKYPLVHQWLLAILDLPVVAIAAFHSFRDGAFQPFDFIDRMQSPEYVTPLLLIGALVSVAMSIGVVYLAYRLGTELAGRSVGLFSALFCALDSALNRFAHVAKVDVPHAFWALVSIYLLARAVRHGRRRDHMLCALAACLSFGTKDQAYAIFVLPFALYLVVYPLWFGERIEPWYRRLFTPQLAAFALSFVAGTLWVENVLLNRSGLIKRFQHLTGDAGFRSAGYAGDVSGGLALLADFNRTLIQNLGGLPIYALCLAGIAIVLFDRRLALPERALRLLPLTAAVSNYLFFVQIIRQSSDRFALFAALALTFYAGLAAARLLRMCRERVPRLLAIAVLALACLQALILSSRIDLDLQADVRYAAEAWLVQHVPAGARIEYYSARHYMPRLPSGSQPYQIKHHPLALPERRPEFVVLSSLDYERYLGSTQRDSQDGRWTVTTRRMRDRTETEFPEFYRKLFAGELGYEQLARFDRRFTFQRVSSVPGTIRIFGLRGQP